MKTDPPQIRTFNHARKGKLIGFIVTEENGGQSEKDEWVTIQLTENFEPEFMGNGGGYNDLYRPGEQITLRKTLISDL